MNDPADLGPRFRDFVAHNRHGEALERRCPGASWPMLQRFYPSASERIYGLSGYAGANGDVVAVRAARKILQRPRKLGIGLCFEEAPVDETIAARVAALCRRVGYRGSFEIELIEDGPRAVLIDYNPRFYSQMAFDIDRGLRLPLFAYADALGDGAALSALEAEARAGDALTGRVYCHRFLFEVMLRAQGLSGRLSAAEQRSWRGWWTEHRSRATHAVADAADRAPWGVDVASHVIGFARHPRAFIRSMVFDQ